MPKNNQSAISKNWSKLSRPGIMSHTSLCKIKPKPFRDVMHLLLLNKKVCLFSSSVTRNIEVLENTVSDIPSRFPTYKHFIWDTILLQNHKADFMRGPINKNKFQCPNICKHIRLWGNLRHVNAVIKQT